MGGAQPLAVAMLGGVCLIADVEAWRLERRVESRYLDLVAPDLDSALREADEAIAAREGRSIGIVMNAVDLLEELTRRGIRADVVTDQTAAHDPLVGYVPAGLTVEDASALRESDPARYVDLARTSMARHCAAIVDLQDRGSVAVDYGNNLRTEARTAGFARAFDYPGFVPAYIRPLFCQGIGPFRWAALSGNPDDIAATDAAMRALFPENVRLIRWLDQAAERIAFQGLPARICWIGYGERHRAGLRFNDLVRSGEVTAPIVIGRDHLDSGSVASPYRETEAMRDGSDAIADWPLLNAMLNTASGAAWVALHHGGGVGIGRSIHSGAQCRGGRNGRGRVPRRAGPHERPGDGRDAPRACGLRPGALDGQRARSGPARADDVTALVPDAILDATGVHRGLAVLIDEASGTIDGVVSAEHAGPDAEVLAGVALAPGFINCHSHAFQRDLRGVVERVNRELPDDDFWTWREEMYRAASGHDPDSMYEVARRAYAEMRRAGYTAVGEFHYVHHRPSGQPYDSPNAMAEAVCRAAEVAGIRIVLLLTAYERGGHGIAPAPRQRRFCDASVDSYLERLDALADWASGRRLVTVGAAPHSIRAVSRDWLARIADHCTARSLPLHIHVDEQPREIEESLAEYGCRPVEVMAQVGALGPRTTIVHGTHLDAHEIELLASSGATVCACPTTEANLGDGYLPARALFEAGVPIVVGSDSNAVIDPIIELREIEAIARRSALRRNVLVRPGDAGPAPYLLSCGWDAGARSLGLPVPAIDTGSPADLVAVDLDGDGLAGVADEDLLAALVMCGSAAAVSRSWVAGRP